MKTLEEKINELPPELQKEALDFTEFLLSKRTPPQQKRMRLTWAGALKDYRDQ